MTRFPSDQITIIWPIFKDFMQKIPKEIAQFFEVSISTVSKASMIASENKPGVKV